ncbi:hypothetical protein L1987_53653 [Smallanthus sonchifolius]|uniref:Uncharacterized protein n=1 Tax=Smallanthus sonchifolius TaxID=185202 RepID=A0ACB9EWK5_9ASTR|nr:hypothetical protein L1987_53653 [Smallanthus sonchifolius]
MITPKRNIKHWFHFNSISTVTSPPYSIVPSGSRSPETDQPATAGKQIGERNFLIRGIDFQFSFTQCFDSCFLQCDFASCCTQGVFFAPRLGTFNYIRMAMQASGAPRKPRILLAASGSVAAIKFGYLCSCFLDWADVKAVATQAALHFIDRTTLPKDVILYTDEDEWSTWSKIGDTVLHIELRQWADIMVIAPLSANTLGKCAST